MGSRRVDNNGLAETERPLVPLLPSAQRVRTRAQRRGRPDRQQSSAQEAHRARRDDYDRIWQYEADEEQSRWDEAQDEALEAAAERFNNHTEDVP